MSGGRWFSNCVKASRPPAEAPTPTIGTEAILPDSSETSVAVVSGSDVPVVLAIGTSSLALEVCVFCPITPDSLWGVATEGSINNRDLRFDRPDGHTYTPEALSSEPNCSWSHDLPARETVSPVGADMQPTGAPRSEAVLGHHSTLEPFLRPAASSHSSRASASWDRQCPDPQEHPAEQLSGQMALRQ